MFKPLSPITSVAGHRINTEGVRVAHDYTLRDNWYDAFEIAADEESRRAFIEGFATPEQHAYNAIHATCKRCRGRGATRKDENVGCSACGGTGAIEC